MLTYLRYGLATVCFALSVGCLALWWRSEKYLESIHGSVSNNKMLYVLTFCGSCEIRFFDFGITEWKYDADQFDSEFRELNVSHPWFRSGARQRIGRSPHYWIYFPLWYPALLFALAGVAALRLGRRFTLRSAIIATAVVAGLLGMAVAL